MMNMAKEIALQQICLLAQKRTELANELTSPANEKMAELYRKLDDSFVDVILAEAANLTDKA